ncbi:phosphate signaling complex protein PhoU [bacterium]|nr:phosphate signaling complex protein PhoU [bacterium]
MQRHFHEELAALKHELVRMAALAETMIGDAITVLVRRDAAPLTAIAGMEEQVNAMQREIDETCLRLIALHQPTASDLRFIIGAIKTNGELERLADQAVNISHKAERLLEELPLTTFVLIPRMSSIASSMVKDALHAYVNLDTAQARRVILSDEQLNELKATVTNEMTALMRKEPATITRALDIILVTRNIERIGDHAKNIAENAVFVAEGRDIRHTHEL